MEISIHALREEGDDIDEINTHIHKLFLSTPSARRATGFVDLSGYVEKEAGKGLSDENFTAALKDKLDGIAAGANKYVHPTHTAAASGLYKTTVDEEGHVTATTPVTKDDITNLGIPAKDTTYGKATAAADGLMAAADKSKLDGMSIATDSEVSEMLAEVYGE